MEGKWIKFEQVGDTGKTFIYHVKTIDGKYTLGVISWFAQWRKYSFAPSVNTVYEQDCLRDIAAFLTKLMTDRKIASQNKKQNS